MTMRPPAYQSEPQILFLYQLIREIAAGHVLLPRFQRPYVWTEEQQLELFRSIRMGTPIGSIMVWRTNVTDVRAYHELGPYVLKAAEGPIRQYIIDGHQRLATLFGALHVPESNNELPERIAYYDLESDDFLFAPRDDQPNPLWMPLRYVLDFSNLLPFQRSFGGRTDEKDLVRRVDIIATAFGTYKLPVLPVVTNDLDHITKTFQRVNSQGTVMSEVHMVSALTWSESFDLNERIALWKAAHLTPLGYGELHDNVVFHVCKAALGFDPYDRDVDSVSQALRQNPNALEESLTSLIDAVRFLRDECRILSAKVVPQVEHLVAIAEVYRRSRSTGVVHNIPTLRAWYWLLAFAILRGRLSSMLHALDYLELRTEHFPSFWLEPSTLPRRFDYRQPQFRLLVLQLAERFENGPAILAMHGRRAVTPCCFTSRQSSHELLFASPGNWIFTAPENAVAEIERILYACTSDHPRTEAERAVLDRHVISEQAAEHLKNGNLGAFVLERYDDLVEFWEEWFENHVGCFIPDRAEQD